MVRISPCERLATLVTAYSSVNATAESARMAAATSPKPKVKKISCMVPPAPCVVCGRALDLTIEAKLGRGEDSGSHAEHLLWMRKSSSIHGRYGRTLDEVYLTRMDTVITRYITKPIGRPVRLPIERQAEAGCQLMSS